MCVWHPWRPSKAIVSSRLGVTDSCKPLCGCCRLNLSFLPHTLVSSSPFYDSLCIALTILELHVDQAGPEFTEICLLLPPSAGIQVVPISGSHSLFFFFKSPPAFVRCVTLEAYLTILVYRHLGMDMHLRAFGLVLNLFLYLVTRLACPWGEDRDSGRYFWSVCPTVDTQLVSLTPGRSLHLNSNVFSLEWSTGHISFLPFPTTRGSMEL